MFPIISKILYATDLTPNSAYVFRYALDTAKKHDARIVILHVIEPLSPMSEMLIASHLPKTSATPS
jgi:nucleotide-binding universal stress UspA family protein